MQSKRNPRERIARGRKQLKRPGEKRESYDRVLLVSEGEKTEVYYFKDLIGYHELSTANVEVDKRSDSAPSSIYERALYLYKEEDEKGNPYDRVYCIFDKDNHETFDWALKKISSQQPRGVFFSAPSIPCFEYWLLLHFKYTTAPFEKTGQLSVGAVAIKTLEAEWPEYYKTDKQIFSFLSDRLEVAKERATRALKEGEQTLTDNPSTHVHELIGYLENLKK